MTCAALGLLLRVSYELDRAKRQVALRRGEAAAARAPAAPAGEPARPAATVTPLRGTSRLRQRIEPTLGVAP